ncbi:3-deoxy-D-manno-octulosonic acid transferase [Thiomicrorhabdus cannonii]|uniref:3-deoxy-D-manno-octulosonic acid transferase n=1 Tax=Thiomicrorhabdus cannonii TaxID=2748011 RepID=UPI0015BE62D6|nr:3-deoxy-D-manno-octulosonic acid transferase [Thiomicrorhabdus cannonii]
MTYQVLIRLLAPLIWLYISIEAVKKHGGWRFFAQRLGWNYPASQTQPVWIHCTSVGEVKAAQALVEANLSQHPVVITTTTPSGAAECQRLYDRRVQHIYLPLDWPYAIRRFLKAVKPQALWVMETEIWPNLLRITRRQCPVSIINGRMSAKTLKAPNWLKQTYAQSLAGIDHIYARSELDAERFRALGARTEQVEVLGNLKYANLQTLPNQPKPLEHSYVLFASSRDDEEKLVVEAWLSQARTQLLVIVPRHPERRDAILEDLKPYRQLVAVHSLNEAVTDATRIYLDDRFGVLMAYFQHAELVIMGGAFTPKGGHNILEPAAYGKAIITGADMSDFIDETALLKAHDALIQLDDVSELPAVLNRLLDDAPRMRQLGEHAQEVIHAQRHVLPRYLQRLQAQAQDGSTQR